jgi:hypothetical protein
MRVNVVRIFPIFLILLTIISCNGSKNAKPETTTPVTSSDANLREPTKEILVTEGDVSKKYTILGEVEYKSDKGSSVYSNQIEARKQAKEGLKKAAFGKYGDKVDAIINAKVEAGMQGGFWGAVGAAYGARSVAIQAEGLAVSYGDGAQTDSSVESETSAKQKAKPSKRKHKSRKAH